MISYEFDVMMNEPNGGSDLMVVEVQLASQQNSDKLPISWDFITGDCTTTSPHLVIDDCEMIGQNGPAGPYEEDITLNVQFHLLWTIPDLGDTKREPKLIVQDRAEIPTSRHSQRLGGARQEICTFRMRLSN